MMIDDKETIEGMKYLRAKKRVEKIKGFYVHFGVYIAVNIMLSSIIVYGLTYDDGDSYVDAFSNFGVYSTWVFWGIGVFFHWLGVFGFHTFFGKNWEDNKLRKIMETEEQNNRNNGFKNK